MTEIQLSAFGDKFLGDRGILRLMDDFATAQKIENAIFMGGGNPSHIPQVQSVFRDSMYRIMDSESGFEDMIGNYGGPEGDRGLISALTEFFSAEYGWDISEDNVALTTGSQTAFFLLFNMLGGKFADGKQRRILLPLAPEYIGYEDVGIDVDNDLFVSYRPSIEFLDNREFKYHVDFDALEVGDDVSAICVSRPTNPTGNVLTAEEIDKLSALAKEHGIPLIVDNAYGTPFPHIIFTDAQPTWDEHIVLSMSLSKLGLPGVRTGIVIANEKIIKALKAMNAVVSLSPSRIGGKLVASAIRSRDVVRLSHEVIMPHYQQRALNSAELLHQALAGLDYFIHKPEGAIFLWLWFRNLPITSAELYQRLLDRGVIIVPGHYFFPGLADDWQHKHECIRVNYAGDPETTARGIAIIGEVVREAYATP